MRLVGHDAPGKRAAFQRIEDRRHVGKHCGALQQATRIAIEEGVAQRLEVRIAGGDAERRADHAARARSDHRPQALVRQGLEATLGTQRVGRAGEVRGAVDQRAVEVEQHRVDRPSVHAGLRHANR